MSAERKCRTCRYWDAHSRDMNLGDCRAPDNHRYSRVPMGDGSYAMLDSFGPEETRPDDTCGAWRLGQADGTLDLSEVKP